GHNFDIRKRVLEYDDVVNTQREAIYDQRRQVLYAAPGELREKIHRMIAEEIGELCDQHLDGPADLWNLEELYHQALVIYPVPQHIQFTNWYGLTAEEIETELVKGALEAYTAKMQELGGVEIMEKAEREITLQVMDELWVRHLTDLSVLREGIGLQGIRGRDPLVEYKIEGFQMYQALQEEIQSRIVRLMYRIQIAQQQAQQVQNIRAEHPASGNGSTREKPEPVRASAKDKIGRNDLCWCGSGKKYKHCHLKQDQEEREQLMGAARKTGGRR
ncbi:MAG: SEC-C domain-containing protein, partial [Anaerolineae bacterium]|nr:SEC-C domain-containing protein [Anaerolineae bacterium]